LMAGAAAYKRRQRSQVGRLNVRLLK